MGGSISVYIRRAKVCGSNVYCQTGVWKVLAQRKRSVLVFFMYFGKPYDRINRNGLWKGLQLYD